MKFTLLVFDQKDPDTKFIIKLNGDNIRDVLDKTTKVVNEYCENNAEIYLEKIIEIED